MNKVAKLFKGLSLLLRRPYLINHITDSAEVHRDAVLKKYNLPDGLPQLSLQELFPDFSETVTPFAFLDGGSLPTDLALLKALARRYKVQNYLEIGTWRGESVANVASVAAQCFTINLPDSTMQAMKLPADYIRSHRCFSEGLPNVTHIQAHSQNFDFSSLPEPIDMVFIDGDHHYDSVRKDTEKIFAMLRNPNAIVVWHDYARTPEIIRWEVLRGILDGCPAEVRKHLYHISNTLCAVYLKGTFPKNFMQPYSLPDTTFRVDIAAEKRGVIHINSL